MKTTPTTMESREPFWDIRLGVYAWILMASWTACMAGSFWWSLRQERAEFVDDAGEAATIFLVQDMLYRKEAAREGAAAAIARGGVFPDLAHPFHPHEDLLPPILVPEPTGPSFMSPKIYELSSGTEPYRSHLVSLKPIRPENAPGPWEAQGLRAFEQGVREVSRLEGSGREAQLHLMRPFLIEKACLACHEAQGYKEGDIRGGISVFVPMAPFWAMGRSHQWTIALTHVLLWIIGLAGIGVGTMNLRRQFSGRRRAEEALRNSQIGLHTLVQTIPDLIWLKDSNGVYLSCNTMFERFFGAREADIMGKTDYDFVDRELADFFRENDRKAMAAGSPTSNEEWIAFADDGHRVLLETIKTPMRDGRGALIGVLGIGRDITERKRAEEALKQSEQRYRSILENMEEGFYEVDLEGNLTFANDAFYGALGRTAEELLGTSYRSLMKPVMADETFRTFSEAFRTGKPTRIAVWEMIHKDGSQRDLEASVIPIRVSESRFSGFRGVTRDITDRKHAEEALRQSEQRYRTILENVEEGFYEVDLEGTLTFANDAFYRILGRTKEELLGTNYRHQMRPEKADETFRVFNKVFRTGERARVADWEMIHKDGSLRAIEASVIPLRTSENRCSGFGGVIRDVTERRRAEEELRTNKANLDLALQAAHMGVWRWNIAENKRVFDDRTCRLLGLDPATFGGTAEEFFAAVHPDDREKAKAAMTRTVEQDEPYVPEHRAVWPDGSIHHLGVRGSLERDEAGRPKRINGLLWDITEAKEAEERLRLAELEREKAKGNALAARLVQGLAHEVRNPLFAINVNAAVLEKKTAGVPGVAESIAFVKEHVGRLDALMRDLLELGHQPTAGDRADCRLRDVAEAAVLTIEARVPEVSRQVVVEAPENPFTVQTIPDRLKRVFVHLIENAIQNSPAESRVRVGVGRSGGQAIVTITDEGSGIPEKIYDLLFEPFVTTHTGRRGLGLALAKHFVESMGGTLEAVNNAPGPGATFTVRLPVGEE